MNFLMLSTEVDGNNQYSYLLMFILVLNTEKAEQGCLQF